MKKDNSSVGTSVLEYLGNFKALIDACGSISYYNNMKNFINAGSNKVKIVASAYQHDKRYYGEQCKEWRVKAKESYEALSFFAKKLGYDMPEGNELINDLIFSRDRRGAYKGYLGTCQKNNTTLSPEELEDKFLRRMQRKLR